MRSTEAQIGWTRWLKAQQYEQSFWQQLGDDIKAGTRDQLDWYGWRARRLERVLNQSADGVRRDGRVLEIGSGPIGIVNFLDWGERFALDPLEHFYCTKSSLVNLRRPGVTYVDGTGEKLPFEADSCSLVIVDNVIDHTYAPARILDEVYRVLQPDGHLFLSVNVHTAWGAMLHTLLAVLRIDPGHPYTFTSRTFRKLIDASRFSVLTEQIESYRAAKQADCQSASVKARVKGYSGLSEFSHSVLCRKGTSDAK